ncbi:hypothetical protein HZF24_09325 [Sedimentibacter hydroxybenzoicus DSM 7310]|uniref:Uncharacterized protein n=1 Tax=Sedimentibacter hydroxybenzoicus DSM 7310 TaxID=1123245 RepID=A0A974GWC3_SEDHY|nr:hypothetical protein [Sedimentibacter hydroxybenzoicus]NYB74332.1 hypothetical protein [Sedimentibacter hydroxybenzoicus DSM 7310]
MRRNMKFIVLIAVLICMIIALIFIRGLLNPGLNKITQQKGYIITGQNEKSIEIKIDKDDLSPNIDLDEVISFEKDDIILYKTDTSTMYLKSIEYENSDKEYLSLTFDFYYDLPQEGTIIVPYEVLAEHDSTSYSFRIVMHSKQAKDKSKVFDKAVSVHGQGPSEQFSIYLKTDVFTEAEDEISFIVDGFNELSYIKK